MLSIFGNLQTIPTELFFNTNAEPQKNQEEAAVNIGKEKRKENVGSVLKEKYNKEFAGRLR